MNTSTTSNEFAHIPLDQLAASLTNPRTSFHPARLQELADSIRASGVHQPILVRPLPGGRVGDTGREVQFEVVAGERRLRACQIAGVATIPAMVRAMTDGEVLEVQIVENLQRDDLTELEEAEGYERLMAHSSLSAEEVGGKIGKSRSYVYARLKLLDLCAEAKQALREGALDASRALLIARIPDGPLQLKALEFATQLDDYDKQPASVRELQTWLQGNVMLRLDRAPFKITDARLLEGAGSCKDCPKRTGANPDLFADVDGADICTDPPCYTRKSDAHRARLIFRAEAKGMRVIDGKEAKEIIPSPYNSFLIGYSRLNQVREDAGGQRLGDLLRPIGQEHPEGAVLIEHPWTHELIEAVPTEGAEAVLLAKGLLKATTAKAGGRNLEKEIEYLKKDAAQEIERAARELSYDALVAGVRNTSNSGAPGLISPALLRAWLIRQIDNVEVEDMATMLDIDPPEANTLSEQETFLRLHLQACDSPTLWRALAIYLIDDDASNYHGVVEAPEATLFTALAQRTNVDLDALKAQATAAVRAETAEKIKKLKAELKPQKPPVATTPLAQPPALPGAGANPSKPAKAAPRKAKLSPEEAQSGIAAALQKLEAEPDGSEAAPPDHAVPVLKAGQQAKAKFAVGQRVRVLDAAALRPVIALFSAKEGNVHGLDISEGHDLWIVALDGRKGRTGGNRKFLTEELETIS